MKIPKIGQTLKTPRAVIDKVAYMSRASLKKVFEGYRIPRIMFSKGIPHLMFLFGLRPPATGNYKGELFRLPLPDAQRLA